MKSDELTTRGPAVPAPSPPEGSAVLFASRWGHLEIHSKLGEGGFGEVFVAYDPGLERRVALKLAKAGEGLREPRLQQFLDEARRLARVRHPNVLTVHGVGYHEGRAGFWMDLIAGKTLEEYFRQERTIGARESTLIGIDLCRALAALHGVDLLHRDLKPSNVMREEGGRIVLMDFGCGCSMDPDGGRPPSKHLYGTPLYMAPEQLRGERAVPATDLYALGVLLYRGVSGRLPIEASTIEDLLTRHDNNLAVPLCDRRSDLPSEFLRVVDKALHPRIEERYASAGAMERALAATLGVDTPSARDVGSTRTFRLPARWLLGAAVGVLALGLSLTSRSWFRNEPLSAPVRRVPSTSVSPGAGPTVAPLAATARLYRLTPNGAAPLEEGARIGPGDDLFLRFQSPETVFVYALNEDEAGRIYVLFPVPAVEPTNPLASGIDHRVPSRHGGARINWEVTSAAGAERIVVVASRTPIDILERDLSAFPRPAPGAPVEYHTLSQRSLQSFRGLGGFSRDSPTREAPLPVSAMIAKSVQAVAGEGNVWIWQIGLTNPGLLP